MMDNDSLCRSIPTQRLNFNNHALTIRRLIWHTSQKRLPTTRNGKNLRETTILSPHVRLPHDPIPKNHSYMTALPTSCGPDSWIPGSIASSLTILGFFFFVAAAGEPSVVVSPNFFFRSDTIVINFSDCLCDRTP